MSRKSDRAAAVRGPESAHGTLLADENPFDRRSMLRLGAWSLAATFAVVLAMLTNQSAFKIRRDELAAADLAQQARQVQMLSQQTQSDSRKLASAVETLNSDRDRLYSRVSSLEQGLDTVTGSIGRQAAALSRPIAPIAPIAEPPPPAAPVASAPPNDAPKQPGPATPLMAPKSLMAPPEPSASKLSTPPNDVVGSLSMGEPAPASIPVPRSEFGIDLGIAPSVEGLRALWKQISTAHPPLAALQPLVVIKERPGIAGVQLRLVAGPLRDANSAAQICAALPPGRLCEAAPYDGQRLALTTDSMATPPAAAPSAAPPKPVAKRKPRASRPPPEPVAAPPAATSPARTSALAR